MLTINALKEKIDPAHLTRRAILQLILIVVLPGSSLGQENPWNQYPKGENPWTIHEKNPEETTSPKEETIEKEQIIISEDEILTFPDSPDTINLVYNDKIREFYLEEEGKVALPTYGKSRLKKLQQYGKDLENANGYLAIGFFSGFVFSGLSIPAMTIVSTISGKKARDHVRTFEKSNPHATREEVKTVSKGLRRKQIAKTMIGNLAGILANTLLVRLIITQF